MSPKGLSTLCFGDSRAPRTGTDQVDFESPSDEVRRPDFGDVFMQGQFNISRWGGLPTRVVVSWT